MISQQKDTDQVLFLLRAFHSILDFFVSINVALQGQKADEVEFFSQERAAHELNQFEVLIFILLSCRSSSSFGVEFLAAKVI